MEFTPTADRLIPELDAREEMVMLGRTLWNEGYRDHLAGHITYNLGDGTLLCKPVAADVGRGLSGRPAADRSAGQPDRGRLAGTARDPAAPRAAQRPAEVVWALHNHSEYGTVWGDIKEVPPAYDQSSSLGGGEVVLVDEYDGAVNSMEAAEKAVRAIGDADRALLGGHGVFVIADTAKAVFSARWRSNSAARTRGWSVSTADRTRTSLQDWWLDRQLKNDGNGFHGFWEAAVRKEMRPIPSSTQKILSRPR